LKLRGIILCLFSLFSAVSALAQHDYYISGTVYDSTQGSPVTKKSVFVKVLGVVNYEKTVVTNSAGEFFDTIPSSITSGVLRVSIKNCHSLLTRYEEQINSGSHTFHYAFDYCPQGCSGEIVHVGGGKGPSSINLTCIPEGTAPFSFQWYFNGNINTTHNKSVFHYPEVTDRLNACVTVSDAKHCKDSICKKIDYGDLQYVIGELTGVVTLNDGSYTDYRLALYRENAQGTVELYADDSILGSPGKYQFHNVPGGAYYLRAEILPYMTEYIDFMPTYLGDSLLWFQSTALIINGVVQGKDFRFKPKSIVALGSGVITGLIDVPVAALEYEGHPIVLFDEHHTPVEIAYSEVDGSFEFKNLPDGRYLIYPDVPGYSTIPQDIEVLQNETSVLAPFVLTETHVRAADETSVISHEKIDIQAFPNPFFDVLYVDNQQGEKKIEKISVFDPMFRSIYSSRVNEDGKVRTEICTESWESGTYIVQVYLHGQQLPVAKLFVKR